MRHLQGLSQGYIFTTTSQDSLYGNGSCVVKHHVDWLLFFLYDCSSCGWEILDVDINVLSSDDSIVDSCVAGSSWIAATMSLVWPWEVEWRYRCISQWWRCCGFLLSGTVTWWWPEWQIETCSQYDINKWVACDWVRLFFYLDWL
jgi:hypothetical protein